MTLPETSTASSIPTVRFRAAGFWRRLLAAIIDLLILSPLFILFFLGLSWILGYSLPNQKELSPDLFLGFLLDRDHHQRILGIAFLFMISVAAILYEFLLHAVNGQTIGERCVGIVVIDSYGERPSFSRSFLRAVGGFISFACAGVGLLWIGFDQKKRGLHDWFSGTYSVRMSKQKR